MSKIVSVYINKEVHSNLVSYLDKVSQRGDSLSSFFIDAANYYIENNEDNKVGIDQGEMAEFIREIVREELSKHSLTLKSEEELDSSIKNKFKDIYG